MKRPFLVSACVCDYFSDEDEWSYRDNIKPYGISQMEKQGDFLIAIAMEYNIHKHREALFVYDIGGTNYSRVLSTHQPTRDGVRFWGIQVVTVS